MNVRALVVDDEQPARDELCYQLGTLGSVDVLGQAENGVDALAAIERLRPDVVFLDVQMPGLDGFEVARRLIERGSPTHIIFVTAFDHYAIEAFEVNAVDYLLKPVDPSRLEQAVARARRRVPAGDQIERLAQMVADRQEKRKQLAVRVGERFLLVRAEEIIYASLAEDSINIVTGHLAGTSN